MEEPQEEFIADQSVPSHQMKPSAAPADAEDAPGDAK